MNEHIQALVDASAQSSSSDRGKYWSMLDSEQKELISEFLAWFATTGVTTNSVNSYKSYLSKAFALGTEFKDLTQDQKSAVRKFAGWVK